MLRRTFLGTLAAMPIAGLPLRVIGKAVRYETCRLTIQIHVGGAPDVAIVTYSDESVRCFFGDGKIAKIISVIPVKKNLFRTVVDAPDGWNVELTWRRFGHGAIDLEYLMMWK